jgi:hypothetical protein
MNLENILNEILLENLFISENRENLRKWKLSQKSKNVTEIIADMLVKHKVNNVFISFRSGIYPSEINVKTRFNTPIGLYAYPLIPILKSKGVKHTKDIRDMNPSDFFSSHKFPFQANTELIFLFHVSDTSNVLFLSKDESSKIRQYVNRIKEMYKDDDRVIKICDDYITTNSHYSNFLRTSKTGLWGFWLMIFTIGEVLKKYSRPRNFFNYLVNELGIEGFVDDIGAGMIHRNEKYSSVFFTDYRKIIDDSQYISRSKGLMFNIPKDKPMEKGYHDYTKSIEKYKINPKFQKYLSSIFGGNLDSIVGVNYHKMMLDSKPVPLLDRTNNTLKFIKINPFEKKYDLIDIKDIKSDDYPDNVKSMILRTKV